MSKPQPERRAMAEKFFLVPIKHLIKLRKLIQVSVVSFCAGEAHAKMKKYATNLKS